MQLASCFIPRTNSLKCIVQLCRNVFFFFLFFVRHTRFRAFILFLLFFFLSLFFFISSFFPSPYVTSVSGQIVKRNLDVCGRFFFFLVGKHQIPIFETNKSSIESMFKARCRRTNERSCDLGYGDGVLFDSFILDRAPRVIRFFWEVRKKENLWKILFFFLLHLIFKNKLNRHSDVILILQLKLFFSTTKNRILQNKIDYNFTRMELHNVI